VGASWDTLVGLVRTALLELEAGESGATLAEVTQAAELPETTVRQALLDLVASGWADLLELEGPERWRATTRPAVKKPKPKPTRRPAAPAPQGRRKPGPVESSKPKAKAKKSAPVPYKVGAGALSTVERWTLVARRLVEGATCTAIARELGVTAQAVSYYRRQLLQPNAPVPRDLECRARAHAKRLAWRWRSLGKKEGRPPG
jgi:hypothetical protein